MQRGSLLWINAKRCDDGSMIVNRRDVDRIVANTVQKALVDVSDRFVCVLVD